MIAKLAVREFKNNLVLARTVDRQYQNVFSNTTGKSVRIRQPVRLLDTPGRIAKINNINQQYTNLTIDQRWNVAVELTDEELTLELNDFQSSVIRPAMQKLANRVDQVLYSKAISFYNYAGTAGTAPSTFAAINDAAARLDSLGIPQEDRYLITSTKDGAALQSGLTTFFVPNFVSPILKERSMGRLAGFDVYAAQNVQRPIVNTPGGTPRVNGVSQTGTSLVIDGLSANQVITAGTVFEIAGIDYVNAISYNDTQYTAKFVVLTTVTADGSGNLTLPIAPSIVPTGAYQTVTSSPADNALVTFQPTHTINVAYHKQAFTLAMINLYAPKNAEGVWTRNMVDPDANISMRVMRYFDGDDSTDKCRFDILFGVQTFPWFGERLMGS